MNYDNYDRILPLRTHVNSMYYLSMAYIYIRRVCRIKEVFFYRCDRSNFGGI